MSHFTAEISGATYGELPVLDYLPLRAEKGEVTVILGANGAGKSTALLAIVGLVKCASRKLSLGGEDVSRMSTSRLARAGICLVPDGAKCFPSLTVEENLLGAAAVVHGRNRQAAQRLSQVEKMFPVLASRRDQKAGTMSGGERQMLSVGRALMTEPQVLLIDEPSAGLAPIVCEELFDALGYIGRSGSCALVVAEQNFELASAIADRVVVLDRGKVTASSATSEISFDEMREAYLGG